MAVAVPFRPLSYGRDLAFGSASAPHASTLVVGTGTHRVVIAVDAVAPGAAADLLGTAFAVGDRTLGSAIDIADLTPTARLSEREGFTGNREWVNCTLIAFITGWFVLFFVRYPGESTHTQAA